MEREIRADYDRDTITIYQAYSPTIAEAALSAGRFVSPFSFHRMTWIKPSFLWLMHRSNWGQKSGQERILAVRIKQSGWEKALSLAVLTSFEPGLFASPEEWAEQFAAAQVHLQWDPERTLRGAGLPYYSIQVGLSRHVIREYVDEWVVRIEDYTPRVRKIYDFLQDGQADKARRHLPPERLYPVKSEMGRRLLIETSWGRKSGLGYRLSTSQSREREFDGSHFLFPVFLRPARSEVPYPKRQSQQSKRDEGDIPGRLLLPGTWMDGNFKHYETGNNQTGETDRAYDSPDDVHGSLPFLSGLGRQWRTHDFPAKCTDSFAMNIGKLIRCCRLRKSPCDYSSPPSPEFQRRFSHLAAGRVGQMTPTIRSGGSRC
ncbi:DUF4291 domain-containing protein [Fimbriiglobus ruber]|nr:DUF4291 domain-containing protein [Fimbriiglobus ruber]